MPDSKPQDKPQAQGAGDLGAAEVQAKVDEAEARGYYGEKVDPEPNESYTLQGQIAAKARGGKE